MKKNQHALRVQLGWGAQCAKKPVINIYYDLVLRICMGNVCFFPMSDPNVDSIHVGVTVIEYGSNGQQKKGSWPFLPPIINNPKLRWNVDPFIWGWVVGY